MQKFIVCAWYTPDYRHWAERFRQSLIEQGAPYDLFEIEKPKGAGWERTTRLKAGMALRFMERHGKTIVLSDVDVLATGRLDVLADLDCDVAFELQSIRLRGGVMLLPRSGIVVIRNTPPARLLVENWARAAANCRYGDTDESALADALAETPGLRLMPLGKALGELIRHDHASRDLPKASHLKRSIHYLLGGLPRARAVQRDPLPPL
jgi:hypothetical protein